MVRNLIGYSYETVCDTYYDELIIMYTYYFPYKGLPRSESHHHFMHNTVVQETEHRRIHHTIH